jgi:DNA-binding transcriptional regulator LsrR (DeoR family)
MTKVARLYHEQAVRQPQIAERLGISQPRVSRLLRRALDLGIVRTTVLSPPGVFAELEDGIERAYGLREAVVVDIDDVDETSLTPALGAAAAQYLEASMLGGERIGISSWSSALLATIDSMRPRYAHQAESVVQLLGGLGQPSAQARATHLITRLVALTGADAVYLPAPGLVASAATRRAFMDDASIDEAVKRYAGLTMLLAGIGSLEPSPLLRASGNAISGDEEERLRLEGAVGDICLRFFDADGRRVVTHLDERVVGIEADILRKIPRRVGIAGGRRKWEAIRAAALGGWVNVLVTDVETARYLESAVAR